MTVIALCYLLKYSNLELFLEKKIYKTIPYELLLRGRSCFVGADNCLYYVMLNYINVLGIEGPNTLVFYKIN